MAIQFGFATLFSSAFPLAPFFAFLNNLFEIRVDAQKYTKYLSRTIPTRVTSIGIWYPIFRFIAVLSVVTNGLQLAITSDMIPRIWWSNTAQSNTDDPISGFAESRFSTFNVSDFQPGVAPVNSSTMTVDPNITECSYIDYREPTYPYNRSMQWWEVAFSRAMFFIVFEHLVLVYVWLIQWLIPDEPNALKEKIKRENHIIAEILVKTRPTIEKKND